MALAAQPLRVNCNIPDVVGSTPLPLTVSPAMHGRQLGCAAAMAGQASPAAAPAAAPAVAPTTTADAGQRIGAVCLF